MQLVIELPSREDQIAFNRRRWQEVLADGELASLPGRIETNAFGNVLMMPPASGSHSYRLTRILLGLERRLDGQVLAECPISTIDGVRAADVAWYSHERFAKVEGQVAFEIAPEICVEVRSPKNTEAEMAAKRRLYFEAGAEEVWICADDGALAFYLTSSPDQVVGESSRCPGFPRQV
jgi:Uma2 family endonuclease